MVVSRVEPSLTSSRHAYPPRPAGTCLERGGRLTVGASTVIVRKGRARSFLGGLLHEFILGTKGRTIILDVFVPDREDRAEGPLPANGSSGEAA